MRRSTRFHDEVDPIPNCGEHYGKTHRGDGNADRAAAHDTVVIVGESAAARVGRKGAQPDREECRQAGTGEDSDDDDAP
jgi:hypothetical protein